MLWPPSRPSSKVIEATCAPQPARKDTALLNVRAGRLSERGEQRVGSAKLHSVAMVWIVQTQRDEQALPSRRKKAREAVPPHRRQAWNSGVDWLAPPLASISVPSIRSNVRTLSACPSEAAVQSAGAANMLITLEKRRFPLLCPHFRVLLPEDKPRGKGAALESPQIFRQIPRSVSGYHQQLHVGQGGLPAPL